MGCFLVGFHCTYLFYYLLVRSNLTYCLYYLAVCISVFIIVITWFGAYGDRLLGGTGTSIRTQAQTMAGGSNTDKE